MFRIDRASCAEDYPGMTLNLNEQTPTLEEILSLEQEVWRALIAGDPVADGAMLTDDFLGVYPSGFANRADHMGELADGPTMQSYHLDDARLMPVSADHVLLAYRATYQRVGSDMDEVMYISSIWRRVGETWRNSFSMDTPAS